MVEVKRTLEDELRECTEQVSLLWLGMGRNKYEIDILETSSNDMLVKARNLNQKALEINKRMQKEKAAATPKEGEMKLDLVKEESGEVLQ